MIDARGFACPQPVVMVQKAVKAGGPDVVEVLVDNRCAVENITRFAAHQGYTIAVRGADAEDFFLTLRKKL